jgi:hypothetical protein
MRDANGCLIHNANAFSWCGEMCLAWLGAYPNYWR